MSSDLISLHIGDRILEVNGTPVKDQPVESIENLIQYSDTVLQVSRRTFETSYTLAHSLRLNWTVNIFGVLVDYRARSRCSITTAHVLLPVLSDADMCRQS